MAIIPRKKCSHEQVKFGHFIATFLNRITIRVVPRRINCIFIKFTKINLEKMIRDIIFTISNNKHKLIMKKIKNNLAGIIATAVILVVTPCLLYAAVSHEGQPHAKVMYVKIGNKFQSIIIMGK